MMKTTADFVRLWTRHQTEVARYLATLVPNPHSAAEILQQVSVGLWEKWADYDPDRPFVPWAIRFAYFEVLKWRQKQARERLIFSDQTLEHLHTAFENETPLQEARRAALEGCLKKLTPQEHRWLERRYGRGSLRSNAKEEGFSMNQVYYAMEQIRSRLLQCIQLCLKKEGWSDV